MKAGLALALLGLGACSDDAPKPPAAPGSTGAAPNAAPVGGAPASSGARQVWFREVTADCGVDFVHDDGATPERHLPETMGGGGLVLDAEGDGDLDLYFVQSGPIPVGAARARTAEMPPNRLYLNQGGARFRDATEASGAAADRGYGQGACAGDVDGDGDPEIYVTNVGPDVLLVNEGGGRFADGTARAGLGDPRWTAGATFFDADADGDLDLYVTAYVLVDLERPEWCGGREPGARTYCHPDRYPGQPDRFYRNRGDGTFADESERAGVASYAGKGLGAIAGDWDGDGDLDVYVAHDSVENKLWRNRGDAAFDDATLLSGTGVDGSGLTEAGMGLASGDYDGDLDLDFIVTNFDDESDTLYRNDGEMFFADATAQAGLEAPSRPPVGFGAVFEDFDLDGDLDLAIANGHILHNVERYNDAQTWRQRAHLFENGGRGRYRQLAEAGGDLTREPMVGRGLYSGDLDGDGAPDLVLVECGGPAHVYRNECGGRSLVLRGLPRGTQVVATLAPGAAGARVLREATAAPSYYGQCAEEIYLALPSGAGLARLEWRAPGEERRSQDFDPPASGPALVFDRAAQRWAAPAR